MAARLRQSLSDFEQAFEDQIRVEERRQEAAARQRAHRAKEREVAVANRRGTLRFVGLVLALIATAVIVTLVMFQTLYWILGG